MQRRCRGICIVRPIPSLLLQIEYSVKKFCSKGVACQDCTSTALVLFFIQEIGSVVSKCGCGAVLWEYTTQPSGHCLERQACAKTWILAPRGPPWFMRLCMLSDSCVPSLLMHAQHAYAKQINPTSFLYIDDIFCTLSVNSSQRSSFDACLRYFTLSSHM